MKTLALAAALAALPLASQANVLDAFSDFFVFGDSLSDPGNLLPGLPLPSIPTPVPLYPMGQFTDGMAWASQLGADLASGDNFAVGGATAATRGAFELNLSGTPVPIDVPDFADQIGLFESTAPALGPTPLASVWFGGNDLFAAFGASDPGSAVPAAIGAAVTSIVTGIQTLVADGITTVAVFGLPDLGAIPDALIQGGAAIAAATQATVAFNATLQTALAGVSGADVVYVDTFGIFADILGDPGAYGFADTATPCIAALVGGAATSCDGFLFYDNIHPTEAVHALIADALTDALAPVPLPAGGLLLIGGLGALALVRGPRPNRA